MLEESFFEFPLEFGAAPSSLAQSLALPDISGSLSYTSPAAAPTLPVLDVDFSQWLVEEPVDTVAPRLSDGPPLPMPLVDTTLSETPMRSLNRPAEAPLISADDKRQRNTAASARFRRRHKERIEKLEETVRDLEKHAECLEKKVEALTLERAFLRSLLVPR